MGKERLTSLTLPLIAWPIGKPINLLDLGEMAVLVVSVRSADGKVLPATGDTIMAGGDTLVLSGKAGSLALAEAKLLRR